MAQCDRRSEIAWQCLTARRSFEQRALSLSNRRAIGEWDAGGRLQAACSRTGGSLQSEAITLLLLHFSGNSATLAVESDGRRVRHGVRKFTSLRQGSTGPSQARSNRCAAAPRHVAAREQQDRFTSMQVAMIFFLDDLRA